MKNAFIMCGLPGSGKSTWVKKELEQDSTAMVVCKDDIRMMLKPEKYTFDAAIEPTVKDIARAAIRSICGKGITIIIDECHITKEKRKAVIDLVTEYEYSATIVLCLSNNAAYNRMKDPRGYSYEKWVSVIMGMQNSFEIPTNLEYPIIVVEQ